MGIFKNISRIYGMSRKLSHSLENNITRSLNNYQFSTSRSAQKSGYILQNDRVGYDTAGLKDYSSLLLPDTLRRSDLEFLASGNMTFGQIKNPRKNAYPFTLYDIDIFRHGLIVGPTGSGKTYGLVIPAMLSCSLDGYRVIANDVKGNLSAQFRSYKQLLGIGYQVRLTEWNPFSSHTIQWNPLDEINDINKDISLVENIVTAIIGPDAIQGDQNRHFVLRDKKWLRGLIRLAKVSKRSPSLYDIYSLILSLDNLKAVCSRHPVGELADLTSFDPHTYYNAVSGLTNNLSIFSRADVRYATSSTTPGISLEAIMSTPGVMIVHSPLQEQDEAFKLSSIFYSMMRGKIYESLNQGKTTLGKQLWMIDEASRIAPKIGLEADLSVMREFHVGVFMAIQSISQLGQDYHNYTSNCATKIVLQGVDDKTAKYFSEMLGNRKAMQISKTQGVGRDLNYQQTSQQIPVLSVSDIMYYPSDFGRHSGLFFNPNISKSPILLDFER